MTVPVLPAVDLATGRVILVHALGSSEHFCTQPHQLVDALQRAVARPFLDHDGVLNVRVAATGQRQGRLLLFPLQDVSLCAASGGGNNGRKLRRTETSECGIPAENPRNFALQ